MLAIVFHRVALVATRVSALRCCAIVHARFSPLVASLRCRG